MQQTPDAPAAQRKPLGLVPQIIIGLAVDTLWIAILYSTKTYWGYFTGRIPQFVAITVMNLALIPLIMKFCATLKKRVKL